MNILNNLDTFFEHEHGFVFNRQELTKLMDEVRANTIDECATVCADLADLTKQCPTGDEFKHVYLFAMDRLLDLKK